MVKIPKLVKDLAVGIKPGGQDDKVKDKSSGSAAVTVERTALESSHRSEMENVKLGLIKTCDTVLGDIRGKNKLSGDDMNKVREINRVTRGIEKPSIKDEALKMGELASKFAEAFPQSLSRADRLSLFQALLLEKIKADVRETSDDPLNLPIFNFDYKTSDNERYGEETDELSVDNTAQKRLCGDKKFVDIINNSWSTSLWTQISYGHFSSGVDLLKAELEATSSLVLDLNDYCIDQKINGEQRDYAFFLANVLRYRNCIRMSMPGFC